MWWQVSSVPEEHGKLEAYRLMSIGNLAHLLALDAPAKARYRKPPSMGLTPSRP
jgi:hypothetical protein